MTCGEEVAQLLSTWSPSYEYYVRRRRWDFLVRHLLGVEPQAGYRLANCPLDFFGELLR